MSFIIANSSSILDKSTILELWDEEKLKYNYDTNN